MRNAKKPPADETKVESSWLEPCKVLDAEKKSISY